MVRTFSEYRHTIHGRQVASAEWFDVINPSTGEPFARAPAASLAQLDEAVASARTAFGTWSRVPLDERRKALKAISAAVEAHKDVLAETLVREQGKSLKAAQEEIFMVAQMPLGTALLDIPVKTISQAGSVQAKVVRKPVGVVAGITPWNFPPMMAMAKIAPAVFCGCTVVLKPSPYTPLTTLMLGEILSDVLPPGVVNVVSGSDEVGAALVNHSGVDKVTFTGSVATGKRIMASCANDLKRVTLELGGNDAAIVREDVDVARAAPMVLAGAMANTGQVCAAIKRVYVHESKYDEFCEAMANAAKALKFGDGMAEGVTHGPINNAMQFNRVKELVEDAKSHGAKVLCGGAPVDGKGYFYPATVLTGVKEGVRVVDEEQFGPVVPVMSFKDDEEALARANNSKFGLCGSVWTSNEEKGQEMAARMECGTAWVNTHLTIVPGAPFGGCKWSGIGREYGQEATIEAFTEPQVVAVATPKL